MSEIGPDAPTLCEGWTTRDLAAHLVVRERRLDAAPGIAIPLLAGYTDKVQRQTAASTDWDELVDKISSGPPLLSPFKLFDAVANMDEMFIHHEDVRRAQTGWEPSALSTPIPSPRLRRPLAMMARLTMGEGAGPGDAHDARWRDGGRRRPRPWSSRVTGDIGELTLFVARPRRGSHSTFSDAQAAQAVRAARRGLTGRRYAG